MDKNYEFSIEQSTSEDRDCVDDKIVGFNSIQVPFTQSEKFIRIDYVIKNNGIIIAGINSLLYCWKCLYIDVLWVDDQFRHQGLGSQLLHRVEDEARNLGCKLAHLDTFDFQGKDFYLKNGYEIFGTLKDCPPGHTRYYLNKKL